MKKIVLLVMFLSAALLFVACTEESIQDIKPFVPVTNIILAEDATVARASLTLDGTVEPEGATNNTIIWTVASAGTTGATIAPGSNILNTTAAGTVTITATITNGLTATSNYTQPFTITVSFVHIPVTNITGVPPTAAMGVPLTLTGAVVPSNATNRTITWSVVDTGTTEATFTGNVLHTKAEGIVVVRATIVNGATETTDYTQDFSITVNIRRVTVTINNNDGTANPAPIEVIAGATFFLPEPETRVNYTFNGWFTSATGGQRLGGGGDPHSVANNATVFAQWTRIIVIEPTLPGESIRPNHISQAQMDADVIRLYNDLRDSFLRTSNNGLHSWFEAGGTGVAGSNALTNSETHGYGMMLIALAANMSGAARGDERQIFDRMNALRRVQSSVEQPRSPATKNYLMSWVVVDVESSEPVFEVRSCWDNDIRCWTQGTGILPAHRDIPARFGRSNSATDGDMDMAYALLLAYRLWGDPQYKSDAVDIIGSIKSLNFHRSPGNQHRTNLGDWHGRWGQATLSDRTTSRPSDWMPGHFRAFYRATGDNFWWAAADEVYTLLSQVSDGNTGLMPDFVIDNPARVVAGTHEAAVAGEHNYYNYSYNSCRVPWRLALDWAHNGTPAAQTQINRISAWLRGATNGDPEDIRSIYRLDGNPVDPDRRASIAFVGPFTAGMIGDVANQQFLNRTYDHLIERDTRGFYNNSLRLLSLFLITGNWRAP